MADTLLRAAPGRLIRDPETGAVLEGEFSRPLDGYTRRLLRDGDLEMVRPAPKSGKPAKDGDK